MDLNIQSLLEYDTDRLLAPFFKTAGLHTDASSFPSWITLDGHVLGHYLSALAIHYAATGSTDCKNRMDYVVSELKRCQTAIGNGYIGGVDLAFWNNVKAGNIHAEPFGLNGVWSPGIISTRHLQDYAMPGHTDAMKMQKKCSIPRLGLDHY